MQVIVSGKQVDVGESLSSYISEKIETVFSKYIDRINATKVVVSKAGHAFQVDISANIGTHSGITVQAHAQGTDAYGAFDSAADKAEKQLRRYKRQITNHHTKTSEKEHLSMLAGIQYVISSEEEEKDDADDNPVIIAEKPTNIEHLTVSDAVMRMDLGELPAIVFVNAANERVNMLYRRADGNIAWVDPQPDNQSPAIAI